MVRTVLSALLFLLAAVGVSHAQVIPPIVFPCEGDALVDNYYVASGELESNGNFTLDFNFHNCHKGERIITNSDAATPGIRSMGSLGPMNAFTLANQYNLTVKEGRNSASYSCFETVTNATYDFDVLKSKPSISFSIGCRVDGSVKIDLLTLLTSLLTIKIEQ